MDEIALRVEIEVRTFPSDDAEFSAAVERLVRLRKPHRAVHLERLLVLEFPGACVRERDPIAGHQLDRSGPWYAFRERERPLGRRSPAS